MSWFHSGRTYELLDRPAEALTEFDSLIALHPESFYAPLAIEEKGDILWRQVDEPALARDMYEKVLLDFPKSLNLEAVRKKLRQVQQLLDRNEQAPKS